MDEQRLLHVKGDEGFEPHFTPEFRARYGEHSLYLAAFGALIDVGLARTMARHAGTPTPPELDELATQPALRSLGRLLQECDARKTAFQESAGTAPLGSLAAKVNERLGAGAFTEWLAAYEAEELERADAVLSRARPPSAS